MNSSSDMRSFIFRSTFDLASRAPRFRPRLSFFDLFHQPMTGFGIKIQFVDSFQVGYALPRVGAERMLAIERVQHDPFQQIAERHVVIFSQAFQDLEQAFLKANPGLNSLNQYSFTLRFRCLAYLRQAVSSCCLWYYSTMVLMYRDAVNSRC